MMCGLAGEIRFDGRAADVAALGRMCDCMTRRGPDGSGVWSRGPIALGHRRLSIIDLSAAGSQPMVDSAIGLSVAFNGCIYNYRDIRADLESAGYRFFSTSDTEVIGKAYAHWGMNFVDHFFGMFAFAIVEHASGQVILGRDRLGIKPLYVDANSERLRFASTLPTLLAAGGTDTSIDKVALAYYMSFHSVVPAPRTILNGVRKLPPATLRVIQPDGSYRDHLYWEPSFERDPARADWSERDWQDALIGQLRTAVERRMVADVPVGVLLSGGIDSSLVVALLAEAGQHGLKTFSIGFDSAGGESGDEFEYSTLVAEHFDTDHHRIKIDSSKLLPGIDAAISAMSEPMVSHDCVAFYLLSEEVAKSIKVVQSGQGADEVLGGYDWYPPLVGVPREEAVEAYSRVFFDRRWSAMAGLLQPDWLIDHDAPTAYIAERFGRPGARTAVDAALRNDTTIMLVDDPVKRVDNMTMAWGLEARVPFLDHELVEFAGTIPPELKLADGGKGVLKRASRGIVPDAVIDRTKGYFPVPAIRQLEGPYLGRVRDALTDPAALERGLFDAATVDRLLASPNETRTTLGSNALWQLALLEIWLQDQHIR
jgi:asparagine synthase (glutamine-hydrolysing)